MRLVPNAAAVRRNLLAWYDANARAFPWRVSPEDRRKGVLPDPYRVWLSEIMLQQTTTAHAAPFFLRFTTLWPTVEALARADDGAVMAAWAGLGYYARARNLLACARVVAKDHQGRFPADEGGLRALPGVGAYTAAAILAIAFDQPATVVDANVERVVSRLFAVETPLPASKPVLTDLARDLSDQRRPGDWAQALMDLGATICGPKQPDCAQCPIAETCRGRALGMAGRLPLKSAKPERPRRYGAAFVVKRGGFVALVRRPPEGLLGGMLALPTTLWGSKAAAGTYLEAPEAKGLSWSSCGVVDHVFSHFALTLDVYVAEGAPEAEAELIWTPVEAAKRSMPTVFKKALSRALGADDAPPPGVARELTPKTPRLRER